MRVATFNVNGIGARLPRLLDWLGETTADAVCLQEIKTVSEGFPRAALEVAGWQALVSGQKGFNGVAVLTRVGTPAELVLDRLPGDETDEQARYLEADVGGVRIASIYLPNGNPQPGPKFDYKLAWMDRLAARAAELLALESPVVLAGDYNVCPTDLDVARPEVMADDALCRPESRARFRALLAQGWTDAIRARRPHAALYTYWDYQAQAWPRNHGLRIDHLLLSPAAADRLREAGIDKDVRDGERASDHVPAWVDLG